MNMCDKETEEKTSEEMMNENLFGQGE